MTKKSLGAVLAGVASVALLLGGEAGAQPVGRASAVTAAHLSQINTLFRTNGILSGHAVLDRQGRVELQGQFENEREVDRAFSLSQTVVGVRWVSPVTPANIKVKAWEECLARLLGGEQCGPAAGTLPPVGPGDETPPGPVANKYALVVGVGRFQARIQTLQYANKDAYDIYSYLVDPGGGNFKRENVILLRDEYATRDAIVRALDAIQRRAQADDLVLLYFSSHGTPPDKYGGVHVVTYDSAVIPRERIWQTSLTEGILRDFIQKVQARRLIVILDACYSNGAYNQVAGFLPQGGKSLEAGWDEGYGRSPRDMTDRLLGAKDLALEPAAPVPGSPMSEAGPRGWGKVLISASNAGERSWESDRLRNSIFTRYLIEGFRGYQGAVKEAFDYATPLVRQQVKREKGPDIDQNPQIAANRPDWNMSVSVSGQ